MKKISIFQTNVCIGYCFFDYKYASENGFDYKDYRKVAGFDMFTEDDDEKILNRIFYLGNTGKIQEICNMQDMRSISVSDIIRIDGVDYYVEPIGFKKI